MVPIHELSITESVITTVSEHVGGAPVRAVTLEIGRLSGLVPDSVRFCFELCTQGTPCEGARLDIIDIPGRARCRDCTDDIEVPDSVALCHCGSANLEITGGQQLKIRQVEIEE
ncbi:MAG TPA: hydrogenase maturation nickel metallochaperone HypA [Pseudonocardiaceae bacterium]|jgi:hydrogenase nickel incorporation protein HypA/HybF|nr:hydrogenase maturation nickel metallochaperone HypA [Pseudonocardiaceae bacterium]